MSKRREWEQTGSSEEGVDESLEQYFEDDDTQADGSGSGPTASPGSDEASGETFDGLSEIVERVRTEVSSEMEDTIQSLRQELHDYTDRTAQSFSDKTASRLTQRQQEEMARVERLLEPLRDKLGPDYEETVRDAKLNAIFESGAAEESGTDDDNETQPAQQQAARRSTDDFAQVYLSTKLGDPSQYDAETQDAIQRELAQTRDWQQWMAVVDKYAEKAGSQPGGGQTQRKPNIARAQPTGGTAGRKRRDLQSLRKAMNRAAEKGDMAAYKKIGAQIDARLQGK